MYRINNHYRIPEQAEIPANKTTMHQLFIKQ